MTRSAPKHKPMQRMAKVHQPDQVERYGQGRGGRPWRRLRDRILLRDRYTCQLCQRVCLPNDLDCDHVIAKAKGGTDDPSNLRALCRPCHKGRGAA